MNLRKRENGQNHLHLTVISSAKQNIRQKNAIHNVLLPLLCYSRPSLAAVSACSIYKASSSIVAPTAASAARGTLIDPAVLSQAMSDATGHISYG